MGLFNHKSLTLAALALATSLLAVGCGKDRSLDDYQQDQANQELARLQAISGTYNGTIKNKATGAQIGSVSIQLDATMIPIANGDNSGTTSQAVLQGGVTIVSNGVTSTAVITKAGYSQADSSGSETQGTVNGQLTVTMGSTGSGSSTATFTITGTMNDNSFGGDISITAPYNGTPGTFTTTKDGNLPPTQGNAVPTPTLASQYHGTAIDQNCAAGSQFRNSHVCGTPDRNGNVIVPVSMAVNALPPDAGTAFVA